MSQGNGVGLGPTDKKRLRIEMRERRRGLSVEEQAVAAKALAKNLLHLLGVSGARRIGAYIANDGEIDPSPALLECMRRGYKCFLPVLFPGQKPRVRFAGFSEKSQLHLNRFGIPEPLVTQRNCLDATKLEWIFLPLVAFDTSGNRLGMGGGYYDSSLAPIRHRVNWRRPRLVGLAYEFQRIEQWVVDDWDVPMHGILTNERFYSAKNPIMSDDRGGLE